MIKEKPPLVFFKNYDLGNDPSGPGEGLYQNMEKYKSVSDFKKKKRKRNMKLRRLALLHIFAGKDINNLTDINGDTSLSLPYAPAEPAPIGILDGIYPREDLDGNVPGSLYYGIVETHMADDEPKKSKKKEEKPIKPQKK